MTEGLACRHPIIQPVLIADEASVEWRIECIECKAIVPIAISDKYEYDIDNAVWRLEE